MQSFAVETIYEYNIILLKYYITLYKTRPFDALSRVNKHIKIMCTHIAFFKLADDIVYFLLSPIR